MIFNVQGQKRCRGDPNPLEFSPESVGSDSPKRGKVSLRIHPPLPLKVELPVPRVAGRC